MAHLTAKRKTRLEAIGRFQQERISRRAADLEERMSMIQGVAARVLELVDGTRDHMAELRSTRAIDAKELHGALDAFRSKLAETSAQDLTEMKSERDQMSQDLHGSLDQFRADLSQMVHDFLSTTHKSRAEAAKALHDALDAFTIALREQGDAGRAQAAADRQDRYGFLNDLRDDVVRIVTEDFR